VKVVEYAVFHAGPGAGAILGDLGADVIKVEAPGGDPLRNWERIGIRSLVLPNEKNLLFELANRNKKGICLDIKQPEGRSILARLVADADVFLTNVRRSTKKKLGIDYEAIKKINPRIVHANVSGFGPEGPVADVGAYDPMGQARSGMMFITGNKDPVMIQIAVLDQATCIAVSHAIITALFVRERDGFGQEVHASLLGTAFWLTYVNMIVASSGLMDPNIRWERTANSPVRNNFCCKDGKWICAVHHPEEKYWPPICKGTGLERLIDDPRFRDYNSRIANGKDLIAIFDEVFATRTRDEWIDILLANGLMFSPVQTLAEALSDPQALASGYVVEFDHPDFGTTKIPGYPLHFSACDAGTRTKAPELGAHTDEVLRAIGYSEAAIKELREKGVVR
jgi:formyl-CoA transferase